MPLYKIGQKSGHPSERVGVSALVAPGLDPARHVEQVGVGVQVPGGSVSVPGLEVAPLQARLVHEGGVGCPWSRCGLCALSWWVSCDCT